MVFSDTDIRAFILTQRSALVGHRDFLHTRYGWRCSDQEAASDWARRYAIDYREIGNRLMDLLQTHPRRSEVFEIGMSEIARHKYLRSEGLGRDLGLKAAGEEWIQSHFPGWYAAL
jgi:hypothetical protein